MAARILLLAPLAVVPRLLSLLPERPPVARLAGWPAFIAALPLTIAFALPIGPLAGALSLPWLAVAAVGGLAAVRHGLPRLPSILRPSQLPDLGVDAALGFWAVAAAFIVFDRLGIDSGFGLTIGLLTATHFHFAGLGLLALASLLAVSRPWLRASVLGLMVGIPLTALGFVLPSNAFGALGALCVGLSGIGVGIALLTGRVHGRSRWLPRVAGLALLVGMPMGIGWSLSILFGWRYLDLDTMIRTHGAMNALAVLIAVASYRPVAAAEVARRRTSRRRTLDAPAGSHLDSAAQAKTGDDRDE